MKLYLLYLLPKNTLYAITNNRKYLNQFLSERNPKIFNVITKKFDDDEYEKFMTSYSHFSLIDIPLEDCKSQYTIIGTIDECNIIDTVSESMAESCNYLKLHFTKNVPFNNEYKEILDALTTISKNSNYHPIIQIDSVKLFYYLFKETFTMIDDSDMDDEIYDIIERYKSNS